MTENERRNLFTYATKELSQDAFLLWLFNNYDDEEVAPAVYALLREFCGLEKDEKILSLETKAQWNKIDVSVWFETNKGKKYALFIEDKVDSGEHNQLEEYNKHTQTSKEEGYEVSRIYYKPGYLYPDEIERVETAGWEHYDIHQIYALFEPYEKSCKNPILRQYIEHILARERILSTTEKPERSESALDLLAWLAFYNKAVIPSLEKEFGKSGAAFYAWSAGHYGYVCLSARHRDDIKIPYLEIRSRDCLDGKFMARILCYGMDEAYIPKQEALIERTKNSELFECKYLRHSKKGKEIFPKQVGYIKEGILQAKTTEEFIEAVKKSVREFLDLMRDWD